jgi:hypothetical protein
MADISCDTRLAVKRLLAWLKHCLRKHPLAGRFARSSVLLVPHVVG